MITITILNEKGGTGKTTLATHIAAGLAISGSQVVLIDADPQANSTTILGLDKSGKFYDFAVRNEAWQNVLQVVHPDVYTPSNVHPDGRLFALAGNSETRNIANSISDQDLFRLRFNQLKDAVDYIIIDTSPTPSLIHAAIGITTDLMLIPTELEAFSAFDGMAQSLLHTDQFRKRAAEKGINAARVAGIIPTMYRQRTAAHNIVLEELVEHYGDLVWKPLNQFIVYAEASLSKQLVFGYDNESPAAKQLWQVVNRVKELEVVNE